MPKRFAGFSFEQHQITGRGIYDARVFFGELYTFFAESYRKSAKPVRLVENILKTMTV